MKPPAANGSITTEKFSTREPTNREITVPRIANTAERKLKNKALLGETGVKQNEEISQLVRDLVENDGGCRSDADTQAHRIRGADNHPVDHVVDAVSEEIHIADGTDGRAGVQSVLVPRQQEFFEHKKQEDSAQNIERRFCLGRKFLKRVRQ